ncbi:MAG: hypothetical protein ACI83P_000014 [Janthinobacterium sp.]|jgi:hypothetical protein
MPNALTGLARDAVLAWCCCFFLFRVWCEEHAIRILFAVPGIVLAFERTRRAPKKRHRRRVSLNPLAGQRFFCRSQSSELMC